MLFKVAIGLSPVSLMIVNSSSTKTLALALAAGSGDGVATSSTTWVSVSMVVKVFTMGRRAWVKGRAERRPRCLGWIALTTGRWCTEVAMEAVRVDMVINFDIIFTIWAAMERGYRFGCVACPMATLFHSMQIMLQIA